MKNHQTISIPIDCREKQEDIRPLHTVRQIPLSDKVTEYLMELAEEMPESAFGVSPSAISQRVKQVVTATDIESYSAHDLRRFYGIQFDLRTEDER